ncbi:hypothetical protein ABEY43_06295 [Priestia megaterium]
MNRNQLLENALQYQQNVNDSQLDLIINIMKDDRITLPEDIKAEMRKTVNESLLAAQTPIEELPMIIQVESDVIH